MSNCRRNDLRVSYVCRHCRKPSLEQTTQLVADMLRGLDLAPTDVVG